MCRDEEVGGTEQIVITVSLRRQITFDSMEGKLYERILVFWTSIIMRLYIIYCKYTVLQRVVPLDVM